MSEVDILDVLHAMQETDREFLRALRFMPGNRTQLLTFHQRNYSTTLHLLRAYLTANSSTATLTIPLSFADRVPANWNDPVPVVPSAHDITMATRVHREIPADTNCSICQEGITEVGSTCIIECGHLFHPNCISEWFTRSVHCPMCRFDIREVSQTVPTSFETTFGLPLASSQSAGWLAGARPRSHTEDTEGSA